MATGPSTVPDALPNLVITALHEANWRKPLFPSGLAKSDATSAVLFLLGESPRKGSSGEPSIILNKRSRSVRQPGDLCFPGGRISFPIDLCGAGVLSTLPFMPLLRWAHWSGWKYSRRRETKNLALLLAAGLREGFEEMRLNPFAVRFLGPMPSQDLAMFGRTLYPMVVWTDQKHFRPNWEVEKIVTVPLSKLLNPENYACCRTFFETDPRTLVNQGPNDFPCFRHMEEGEEVLWGVTYRIVTLFLEMVFKFRVPEMMSLPLIRRVLDEKYLHGSTVTRR